jgi:hypothetical protein
LGIPNRIIPPTIGPASWIVTSWPRRVRWYAAESPEGPAPTMSTRLPEGSAVTSTVQPRLIASSPRKPSTELIPTASSSCPRLQDVSQGW